MALTKILEEGIKDGEIVNADINASAAIATSKITGLATSATTDTTNASNIGSGSLANARLTKPIDFADNEQARFGTGNDFTITHDGSNARLINTEGNLILFPKTGEYSVVCIPDGAVELYYDNAKKLHTVSTGVNITGRLSVSDYVSIENGADIFLVDNGKAVFGNGSDLEIYHDGTNSIIHNKTGQTWIQGSELYLSSNHVDGQEKYLKAVANGAVELYHNGTKKFETTSYGSLVTGRLNTTGNISMPDNAQIHVGDSSDLQIYHDGSHSYVTRPNGSDGQLLIRANHSDNGIVMNNNGAVELYYNGVKKIETEADGVNVIDSNSSVHVKMTSSDGVAGYLLGTGSTTIGLGDNVGHYHIKGVKDGEVELNWDNNLRFQTHGDGISLRSTSPQNAAAHWCEGPFKPWANDTYDLGDASYRWRALHVNDAIYFGGNNTTATQLDDYEEGTWTPTINVGVVTSGSDALAYSGQQGWYVKIGSLVQASFYILFTAMGDGNNFSMAGLPYSSINLTPSYSSSGVLGYQDCNFTNNATQMLYIGNNGTAIFFYNNNAGTHSPAATKIVSTERIASNLYGTVTYRAN